MGTQREKSFKKRFAEEPRSNVPKSLLSEDDLWEIHACGGEQRECPFMIRASSDLREKIQKVLEESGVTEFVRKGIKGPILPHHRLKIAIAGCPNGCSQPQIKDIGIIAQMRPAVDENAECNACDLCKEACPEQAISISEQCPVVDRESCLLCGACISACPNGVLQAQDTGYRIIIGGTLGRHPRLATLFRELVSAEEVPQIVAELLDKYMQKATPGERFASVCDRLLD